MLLLYMEVHFFPIKQSFNAFVIHGGSWDVFSIKHSFNAFVIHGGSWDVFSY